MSAPTVEGTGPFRSLRIRNFRIYAMANIVSNTGTWMQRIAQDWLVLQLSDSGLALGIVTALQFLPVLIVTPYGGVLADRYDKRRLMMLTQATMGLAALLLGLLVVTDVVALWHVFVLAGFLGIGSALDMPVRQSFVCELVGAANLPNAVSLNSSIFNAARLVGPAVAGLLIAAWDNATGPVFLINAVSFLGIIAALRFLRTDELEPAPPQQRGPGQLRAAVTYLRLRPEILRTLVLIFVVGTFGMNFQITLALFTTDVYERGADAFGLLSTAFAVGSLAGALLSARRSVRPRQRFLFLGAVGFGLAEVVVALMPTYESFAVLLVPTGMAAMTFIVAANSFVQLGVDAHMRGRVMALYFVCFMGGTPVGAPIIGWFAEHFGARLATMIGGGVVVVVALILVGYAARQQKLHLTAALFPRPSMSFVPDAKVRSEPAAIAPGRS